tara:strand:- start:4952 stop:6004 length:1053 start_codon:yes stop_codon:yes gene_type:complete
MSINLRELTTSQKVELFKQLYCDITGKGHEEDIHLAHINEFERKLLISHGGAGTVCEETGLLQFFGGGGGGGSAPATQTQFVREAPGIEERKLELMDLAADLTAQPEQLPAITVSPLSQLEQQGVTAAGTTGVGAGTTLAGIGSVLGAEQAVAQGPNIQQFYNPYQSYVLDEISRRGQMAQQGIADQAIRAGAFGGGREGVQRAELQGRTLETMGRAQQQGFNTALQAAQQQQALQAQTGLSAGQQLGALGVTQQQQAQSDINQLMAAGGLQRQLAQTTADAARQSQLQQQYEPYQRLEFLKNIYAAGPTSQSGITAATQPTTSPLAQSIGTGIGAFAAYQGVTGGQKQA